MPRIKLVVVASDQLSRDSLRRSLGAFDATFECAGDFACSHAVVRECRAVSPDVVVFDLSGRTTLELLALHELASHSAWALLVIANRAPDHVLEELVTRRRSGFFSRSNSLEALAQATTLVALGGSFFDGPLHELLVRRTMRTGEPLLSQRERHVLQLVAEGYSTKEVAEILHLSIKTVDNYRTSLMQKLGVHDVVRLTHYAIRTGLVRVA
ncbi:MAG: hypothetical protein C0518_02025 [Opitutus sp.]|nr:hypothetical protein [Opitutus sp.]